MHNIDGPCTAFASMHSVTVWPTNNHVQSSLGIRFFFVFFLIFASIILWHSVNDACGPKSNRITLYFMGGVKGEGNVEIESEMHECGPQVHTIL